MAVCVVSAQGTLFVVRLSLYVLIEGKHLFGHQTEKKAQHKKKSEIPRALRERVTKSTCEDVSTTDFRFFVEGPLLQQQYQVVDTRTIYSYSRRGTYRELLVVTSVVLI